MSMNCSATGIILLNNPFWSLGETRKKHMYKEPLLHAYFNLSLYGFAYKTHFILQQDETNIFAPVTIMSLLNPTHHL